jgi:hypothetical protein
MIKLLRRNGDGRREVVQVLLALTIISTVAGVIGVLCTAIGLLLQRRQAQPQSAVIVVMSIAAPAADTQTDGVNESGPESGSAA